MSEEREAIVVGGQYLGEISALCFLNVPPHFSSLPYLLAGTGSQILLFNVESGWQIKSFPIFEGLRVHGLASGLINNEGNTLSSSVTFNIVVSGERRVKLYSLCLQLGSNSLQKPAVSTDLILLQILPRFSHWVLDICFLQDGLSSSEEGCRYLAIGCSDNSVHIWDVFTSSLIFEVRCPERCLLYSMRLWGNKFEALRIASGTIYNEIVVWKLVNQHAQSLTSTAAEDLNVMGRFDNIHTFNSQHYEAHIVSRLAGHHGSIFCLSWSKDGSKLVSVSDDRSARMWITTPEINITDDSRKLDGPYLAGPMLFGHGARVWDCYISEALIVTAGEDCTCRVWGLDGKELRVIKEHIGRGIWRCLYDPKSSLLVTAGFDSAIKVQCLHTPSGFSGKSIKEVYERRAEVFKFCIPNSSGHVGLMDSKSEYVRCLKFAREDVIYAATNHGCVYHGKLSDTASVEWTELVRVTEEVPIICMDLLSRNHSELSLEVEDWVAVGDGKGAMKVIKVLFNNYTPKVAVTISWSAEMERQLLGAYWCKSLGDGFVFTSNPRGSVKLWRWSDRLSHDCLRNCDVHLVADFMSPFGARIMCLDASPKEEVLVCGDLRGNLVLFPLPKSILLDATSLYVGKTSSLTYFKGAHGISTVSSISLSRFSPSLLEICSTGGDGCICYLEYGSDQRTLEFVGMKQIKELSLVQSVSTDHYSLDDSANISYAVGFSATDFLIWNLLSETKILQVKCGGWRRPHSYHLGHTPDICSSFAYVKDEIIYIHRYWAPHGEKNIFPRNLHLQFHGREIHSLCFISEDSRSAEDAVHRKSSWIATGCEDGTVRLTRYNPDGENGSTSNLLGEHVGGSAVRSLCFVSKMHSAETKVVDATNDGTCRTYSALENINNPCLLLSVGAKRVLTSWLLRNKYGGGCKSSSEGDVSFKWLSTDMPVKCVRTPNTMQDECVSTSDAHDNDWRYLAVTAFLVGVAESRLTVCFVVVACSDATLTLRALVLPYRYWFDVACLAPLSSPVLALQHAVIPLHLTYQDEMMTKNVYIVISGSTDGTISFWDLSQSVEAFVQRVSSLHIDKSIDFQKRPRTGRGSQGGRWWRCVDVAKNPEKVFGDSAPPSDDTNLDTSSPISMKMKGNQISIQTTSFGSAQSCDGGCISRFSEIKPLHNLNDVHQSGVNCLHICCQNLGNGSQYNLISGGDDQALNFLRFVLQPAPTRSNLDNTRTEGDAISLSRCSQQTMSYYSSQSYSIKFLYQNKSISAHSSAVKGVWTDGIWAFSTGLDQRVRCWNLQEHGNLAEHSHFITSVPEPEALDVRPCGGNYYQVVVAGRGMQMVEFSVSSDED